MVALASILGFALTLALILLGGAFAAFWVTIFLVPLWRWIEAEYGIEAIGHSGPAEWCLYLVYAIVVALTVGCIWGLRRKRT